MKRIGFILLSVLLIFTLASCNRAHEHVYDNAQDASCNDCGETREVAANNGVLAASFASVKSSGSCTICGATDDGDCATPVTCNRCSDVIKAAMSHNFSGSWQTDAEGHWLACTNEQCKVTETKIAHTIGSDGTCIECSFAVLLDENENGITPYSASGNEKTE